MCWEGVWAGKRAALAVSLGPSVTTVLSLLTPSCSHLVDTLFPGHSAPFLDSLSLQYQALCQESLFLFFLENSSFKIQLGSPLFHEATLDTWGGISHSVFFISRALCTPISHVNSCHTILKYTVPIFGAPRNLSEGGRAGVGGWALVGSAFTAMFMLHGLSNLLSFSVHTGLIMPIWRITRSIMPDT